MGPEKSMFHRLVVWSLARYKQPTKDHPLSILKSLKWANWEEEQFWRMFGSSDQWQRWNSGSRARALQLYKHHQQTYCCLLCCVPSQSVPFKGCFRYKIFLTFWLNYIFFIGSQIYWRNFKSTPRQVCRTFWLCKKKTDAKILDFGNSWYNISHPLVCMQRSIYTNFHPSPSIIVFCTTPTTRWVSFSLCMQLLQ